MEKFTEVCGPVPVITLKQNVEILYCIIVEEYRSQPLSTGAVRGNHSILLLLLLLMWSSLLA